MITGNLFRGLPAGVSRHEITNTLCEGHSARVERIISTGQSTPDGHWYDQDQDEFVLLLSGHAVLRWDDGSSSNLEPGDWLLIPAHKRHRVEQTSSDPPCVWLTVHATLQAPV